MGRKSKWSNISNLQAHDFRDKETFSSLDMNWTEIHRSDGSIDRVALIPYNRLRDFIRGEESHLDTLCKFVCKASRSCENRLPTKRPSASKQYCIYWCCYGPEDKRGSPQPPIRKRSYARKRGCQCHFIVKEISDKLGVAVITYNMHAHEDGNGLPCHGKYDRTGDSMPIVAYNQILEDTEVFEVRDALAQERGTHDLPDDETFQIDTTKNAFQLESEVHNTLVPRKTYTVVAGGESTGSQNDSTSCELVVQDIFDKLKMVLDHPPQSLSKALQLRELVNNFLNDVSEQCILEFNLSSDPSDPSACGSSLKRKKNV